MVKEKGRKGRGSSRIFKVSKQPTHISPFLPPSLPPSLSPSFPTAKFGDQFKPEDEEEYAALQVRGREG